MIAIDTNILVYAHRADSPFHDRAAEVVKTVAEGDSPWAIPWPCLHEFVAVVTNPRVFKRPTPLADALAQVTEWLKSPTVTTLGEADGYWETVSRLALAGRVEGAKVHDARIAALARFHAVDELWSADRDFGRFPSLKVRNPLVA